MQAAQTIVYLGGVPYVEGQALIHQSCAGSQCHAASAVGAARTGAPHGLDLDVAPMTMTSTPANLTVLQSGVNRIRDEAEELWSVIDSGEMPPLPAGDRVDLPWYKDAEGTMPAMLTGVDLDEARQKVRNWLACAAPVVAATADSPMAEQVKSLALGAVMPAGKPTITPTFDSIYTNLLVGANCGSCHSANSTFRGQALNFSTADAAYMGLVRQPAFATGECKGATLVVPNDCQNSLLYQKLLPEGMQQNACGAPMPYPTGAPPTPPATLQVLCDWINMGAPR